MAKLNPDLVTDRVKELLYVRNEDGEFRGWKRELLGGKLTKIEEKYILCKVCQGLLKEACLFDNEGEQELRCHLCLPENTVRVEANLYQESVNEKCVCISYIKMLGFESINI